MISSAMYKTYCTWLHKEMLVINKIIKYANYVQTPQRTTKIFLRIIGGSWISGCPPLVSTSYYTSAKCRSYLKMRRLFKYRVVPSSKFENSDVFNSTMFSCIVFSYWYLKAHVPELVRVPQFEKYYFRIWSKNDVNDGLMTKCIMSGFHYIKI